MAVRTIPSMRAAAAPVLAALLLAAAGCGPGSSPAPAPPTASPIDPEQYYAVLLENGTVYYGRLEGYGTAYPVLRDVYYVQRTLDEDTKAVSNLLVKRGRELHEPDHMILNPGAITFIEPVGDGSKIAGLIEQARRQ